jgi:hypothetical protein
MIYETFFYLSPDSKTKFKDLNKQGKVLSSALKMILTDDVIDLEKHPATKETVKRMREAHRRYGVSELEFHHMKQAITITSMFFLKFSDEYSLFQEFSKGLNTRFSAIHDLVVVQDKHTSFTGSPRKKKIRKKKSSFSSSASRDR